ncbi:MAG: hypothetical protein JNJ45_00845 [Chthonomonas sp.]|nr:hypothetical protein [Chthonomonas sp.]
MQGKSVRWPIKVWFVFHAVLITLWSIPKAPPPLRIHNDPLATAAERQRAPQPNLQEQMYLWNDRVIRAGPLSYYIISTGFWQYWDMFAPNPSNMDCHMEYEVIYTDGSSERRNFYRIYAMGQIDKFLHERFRKYVERLIPESAFYLWPGLAKRLAYESYERRRVMPSRVRLILVTSNVAYGRPKPPMREIEFYHHVVNPKDVLGMEYR